MGSMNLLVTGTSSDSAERINSLLRNSGIKIHVMAASTALEVKKALDRDAPLLVICADPETNSASIEEVGRLAFDHAVPFAVYSDFQNPSELIEAMTTTACFVIHSENDSQLVDTVKRLAASHELNHNQQKQQNMLEELQDRYELLFESARDAIAYIHEGLHVCVNRAYLEALGVKDISEIVGVSLLELMKAEGVNLKKVFQGLSRNEFPEEALGVSITRLDGTEFEAQLSFAPARFNGEACTQMLMHQNDATSSLATELEKMRDTDSLTQLNNRRSFIDRLKAELAQPRTVESIAAILYVEPDEIAELQEELDVVSMDALIADLASVLKSCLDAQDEAARVSDHGFAVLTKQPNMEHVEALSEKILKAFCVHLVEFKDRSLSVPCSIGIAPVGRLAKNWREVIADARKAQAEAVETGNGAMTFRPQLTAISSDEDDRQWIDRIKIALTRHDFYSVQQCIIDVEGEGEHLMENLTYLRDETGDMAPHEFMGIADRNNLAGAIDRHIIPSLLKSFIGSTDKQIITLSENSILDHGFPAWLHGQMTACCIEGNKLVIQISAAIAQSNLKPVQRLMHELAPLGYKFSISGFDAERRTRQMLEHLGASYVKILPSLTESLTGNASQQEVIRNIVDAAESRGICVIADEVSDTSSLGALWQCGVKLIAGACIQENSQVVGQ